MSFRMFKDLNVYPGRSGDFDPAVIDKVTEILFRSSNQTPSTTIPASLTYIGQMLSHELVPATNGLGRPTKARLSLASMYGEPVDLSIFKPNGMFFTGHNSAGAPDTDLLRDHNDLAVIPEPRNDENLLISQMHLFWMRVHNKIVQQNIQSHWSNWSKEEIISRARAQVLYLFHRVTVEDFLYKLLHVDIYQSYFEQSKQYFLQNETSEDVPVEFSMACFRLGHSMVRSRYELQEGLGRRDLVDLLRHTNMLPIGVDDVVDWIRLSGQGAHRIDSFIAPPMGNINCLPTTQVCMGSTQIVKANLNAGRKAALPYPNDIIDALVNAQHDVVLELGINKDIYRVVEDNAGELDIELPDGKLPMWLFILVEAEQFGFNGDKLGKFASMVVGEVLSYCIRQQADNWFDFNSGNLSPPVASSLDSITRLTFKDVAKWL